MLGFPLGILSAAGAAVADLGSYDLLQTQVLGTAVTEVTFSSLATYASDYKHLQVRMTGRSGAGNSNAGLRINGVTTTSYSYHQLNGNGSSVSSEGFASNTQIFQILNLPPSDQNFAAGVIDILDAFSTTKNKTVRRFGGYALGFGRLVSLVSGALLSTDSTTSLTIFSADTLGIGSRLSLYGIKG